MPEYGPYHYKSDTYIFYWLMILGGMVIANYAWKRYA
jgi:hypothetical protein